MIFLSLGCILLSFLSLSSANLELIKYDSDGFFGLQNKKHNSKDITLELLVVYDETMFDFYGDEYLKKYILALFQRVNEYFSHPSIGYAPVSILVNGIIKLDNSNALRNFDKRYQNDSLSRVCQNTHTTKQRFLRDNGNYQIDSVVVLTRYDLCNENNAEKICALVGHTQPCEDSGCVLVQDRNLLTAYAIAQKLGQVLGMNELNEDSIDFHAPGGNIMNKESNYLNDNNYRWSDENIEQMQTFIEQDQGKCLARKVQEGRESSNLIRSSDKKDLSKPGRFLTNDLQCQIMFGRDARFDLSRRNDDCSLTCRLGNQRLKSALKRFDFSECDNDPNKICYYGKCVTYTRAFDEPFYGEWTEWSDWTRCNRKCSTGIRSRTRKCIDKDKQIEGNTCHGLAFESFECKYKFCDVFPDYYDLKCEEIAKTNYKYRNFQSWNASFDSTGTSCEMTCWSDNKSLFKTYAPDGAYCNSGRCIQHTCQRREMKCGEIFGANVRWFDCGNKCIGDESHSVKDFFSFEKKKFKQTYERVFDLYQFGSERKLVAVIPKDAQQAKIILKARYTGQSLEDKIVLDLLLGTANLRIETELENNWIEFRKNEYPSHDYKYLEYHGFDQLDKDLEIWIENLYQLDGQIEVSYYMSNNYNKQRAYTLQTTTTTPTIATRKQTTTRLTTTTTTTTTTTRPTTTTTRPTTTTTTTSTTRRRMIQQTTPKATRSILPHNLRQIENNKASNCFSTNFNIKQNIRYKSLYKIIPSGSYGLMARVTYSTRDKDMFISIKQNSDGTSEEFNRLLESYKENVDGYEITKTFEGQGPFYNELKVKVSNNYLTTGLLEVHYCLLNNNKKNLNNN